MEQLAEKAGQGDKNAFSELVRINMNEITALTYRMTRDKQAAADLTQETFIAAWKNIQGFRGESSVSSWLYRIAANKTLNYLKREKHVQSIAGDQLDLQAEKCGNNPADSLELTELREGVLEFMQTLPPQQRIAFELRFYKQQSFKEISEGTQSALGTVKTNYREAVKKLKKYAIEKGWR